MINKRRREQRKLTFENAVIKNILIITIYWPSFFHPRIHFQITENKGCFLYYKAQIPRATLLCKALEKMRKTQLVLYYLKHFPSFKKQNFSFLDINSPENT